VFFSEGATLGPDLQFFKNGGGLLFLTSNAGTVTVKSFGEASSASAEITLKDFNFGNDTYDIWVDDVLILNNTPFKSDIGELNTFGISGASNSSNVYIDDISAVPEPSTYALFGIGLLGFFGGWIRKKAVSCKH